jgi:hypothetical protein
MVTLAIEWHSSLFQQVKGAVVIFAEEEATVMTLLHFNTTAQMTPINW